MNRFCTHCYRVLATPNWNHALITPFIDPIATKTSFWMSILNLIRKKNTKTRRPNISSGSGLYLRLKHRHRMQHLWCHVLTLHQPFPISSGSKSNIFPPFCVSTAKSTLHLFEVKIEVIVIQHPTQVELGHYSLVIRTFTATHKWCEQHCELQAVSTQHCQKSKRKNAAPDKFRVLGDEHFILGTRTIFRGKLAISFWGSGCFLPQTQFRIKG